MPNNDHGDPRHILLPELIQAAQASGISVQQAAANIPHALRDSLGDPAEMFAWEAGKPTLVFDADDTLAFTTEAVLVALNAAFDTRYTLGNVNSFSWRLTLPPEHRAWISAQMSQPDLYENLCPDWRAVDTLLYARAHGYPVRIATERDVSLYETTAHWLDQWDVQVDGLHVLGQGQKLGWLAANFGEGSPAIVVDDNPRQWSATAPGINVWTPRHPWTPHYAPPGVWVFDTWEQARAALAASI